MSGDFRGEFYQKVDAKARVSVPADFRHALEAEDPPKSDGARARPRLYMVYGGKSRRFVECYSKLGMDRLTAKILAMPMDSEDRRRAERDMIQRSVVVEIEPDGRIVLPPNVRAKMGYPDGDVGGGGEAAFAGQGDRFELYRREVFAAQVAAEDDDDDGTDPRTRIGRHHAGG
jgi:MraZ protein